MSKLALCAALGTLASAKSGATVSRGARAVDLLARTVTDRDVPAFTVGVRERHSDHRVLHGASAIGLGVVREAFGIAETIDEVLQFFVGGNDRVFSERAVGFGCEFRCGRDIAVAEEVALCASCGR